MSEKWVWRRIGAKVWTEDGKKVADVNLGWCSTDKLNERGHLIAAAPELYEALELAEDMLADMPDDDGSVAPIRRQINATLAKARGESQ